MPSSHGALLPKEAPSWTTDSILDAIGPRKWQIQRVFCLSAATWTITAAFFMVGAFVEDPNCDFAVEESLSPNCHDAKNGSLIYEFSLFGENAQRKHWFTSAFMLGNIFGGSFLSLLGDVCGRRPVACFSLLILGISSLCIPWVATFEQLAVLRFLQGVFYTGTSITVWVLGYESIPGCLRSYTAFVTGITWVVGYCVVAPLAFYVPDWRNLMFSLAIPTIIYAIVLFVFLPESLHFLVTKKREAETRKWVADCGETVLLEEIDWNSLCRSKTPDASTRTSLLQTLATNRKLLLRLAVFSFLWTTDVLVYVGMSLFSVLLAGNRYTNYVAIGLIEVPAYIVGPIMLDRLGRRCTVSSTHFGTAVAFLLAAFVLTENAWAQLIFWLLAKFAISVAFMSLYIFASESFPTAERSVCVGICTVVGKFIGVSTPFIESTSAIWTPMPLVIFATITVFAGLATLLLPETKGKALPEKSDSL